MKRMACCEEYQGVAFLVRVKPPIHQQMLGGRHSIHERACADACVRATAQKKQGSTQGIGVGLQLGRHRGTGDSSIFRVVGPASRRYLGQAECRATALQLGASIAGGRPAN